MAALLVVDDARIDIDGVPVCEGLTLEAAKGDRAVIIGAPRGLFEATCGLLPVVRGKVIVRGAAPKSTTCAAAPLDPPLPKTWKALEYVTWSARLGGSADAKKSATDAMKKLKLDAYLKSPIANLPLHVKRALVVAGAFATPAQTIVLQDPTTGVAEDLARIVAQMIASAIDRPWILFAARPDPASPLFVAADETISIRGARGSALTSPTAFVARVEGAARVLAERLAEQGIETTIEGQELAFDLKDRLTTADLFALAVESEATVVELRPADR